MATKKLIEVALPLEEINKESAREKSIRHGHPSTLHLWWARRPLAAARAVIWSSLVDDPSSHPEEFPTEEAQTKERERLFKILRQLVVWENSNNPDVLRAAKAEIMKSTNNNPPALLDPFAGGGAIPLEAQRLGLEAHAHDLNPVAVTINKAMIEIPPRFANRPPVNPPFRADTKGTQDKMYRGAMGLAADVKYYGDWMKTEAFRRIGHLYPKVKVPKEQGGGEATVIAWIWARTVKCPNPACGCRMPLASSFVLSKKKGHEAWVEPIYDNGTYHFTVKYTKAPAAAEFGTKFKNEKGKAKRGAFRCEHCGAYADSSKYVDVEANAGRMGSVPMAVVAEGDRGRIYLDMCADEMNALLDSVNLYYSENDLESVVPHAACRGTFASNAQGGYYGFHEFKDYFTKRQLIALTTFSDLVAEAQALAEQDARAAGLPDDGIALADGGSGTKAYGQAVGVYLSLGVSRMTDINNSLCRWEVTKTQVRNLFTRQAIPMIWDYAENNVFNNAAGDFMTSLGSIIKVVERFNSTIPGFPQQYNAQNDCGLRDIIVSTDPPYYDNIGYADLSDFFYVWLRKCLKSTYYDLFRTMLVPKAEELIATPYRHNNSVEEARDFFENGMVASCKQIYKYTRDDIPVTIYYAYKQSDTDEDEEVGTTQTASTGWETMLNAIIQAGFAITGTWPMRTELSNRALASGTNALASSIVLVCRKRPADAPVTTRRALIQELKRELRPALDKLRRSNIAPVDLAQSAIGPGMGVFSKYSQVLDADGTPMSVRSALAVINQELDSYFNDQDSTLDSQSRFCVDLFTQFGYNTMKFGDADTLARAKNTSVSAVQNAGVVAADKGYVRLLERKELTAAPDVTGRCVWLQAQQITHAMAEGGIEGCAKLVATFREDLGETAKDLAYRLYTISERKGWNDEAFAYNVLVQNWPDIQARAAQIADESSNAQIGMVF